MQYEYTTKSLVDLKPHPKNPRKHPDTLIKKLVSSIETYGFTSPVLVDGDNRILAGHARCKAAEKMGLAEVPCITLPLTGAAADAYVVVDNKLNELSEWDESLLADLISDIDGAGFDVELTGFDIDEIDALLSPKGCKEDDFDTEKAVKEVDDGGGAVTQTGDIWILGSHKIICGDTTLPETFEKLMVGEKAQLCVTSPPYGVGKEYEKHGIEPWFETMRPAIKHICKHAETVCYNIGDLFTTGSQFCEPTFAYSIQMFAENGFRVLWTRVWDKKRQALSTSAPYHLATNKPIGDAEYIAAFALNEDPTAELGEGDIDVSEHSFVTAFSGSNYKFVKRLSKQERREFGYTSLGRVLSVQGKPGKENHHATFPVTIPWRCVKMHSDKGNIVLEPFSGTFTTGIACEQTDRRCFAIEREPKWIDVSIKRWVEFTKRPEDVFLIRGDKTIPLSETEVSV
jgi:DNA modification methylase